jgi:hypothetical protein
MSIVQAGKIRVAVLTLLALGGCANHPIDCAVGFYHSD